MPIFCKLSFFFLIMSLSTCYQIQARESKFFSKYRHLSTTNYVTIPSTHPKVVSFSSPSPSPSPITSQISGVPASAPIGADSGSAPAPSPIISGDNYSPAPAPAIDYSPTPVPTENDVPYYGLYAKETNDKEDEFSTENPEEFSNGEPYTYNNGYSNSLSNNNGFWTSNQESFQNTNSGYNSEPQGMSDTRLQNDGKYYYDVQVQQENHNPTGYKNNNEEGYYDGNYKKPKYEFDSMEEYEKQEGFADVEQEFIP